MALTTVKITGTFNFPDASWAANTQAEFMISGYDTDTDVVVPDVVKSTLSASGALDVDLWGNDDGLRGTVYRVNIALYSDDSLSREVKRIDLGRIQINGGGPLDIATLLDSPVTVPEVWYSTITEAEYDAAIQAAADAAASAADAALYDGPRFDTIGDMAAWDGFTDGKYAIINGTGEQFTYSASATETADGTWVVDATGMGVGRLFSLRREIGAFSELESVTYKNAAAGTILTDRKTGARYEVLPVMAANQTFDYTGSGGVKIRVLTVDTKPDIFNRDAGTWNAAHFGADLDEVTLQAAFNAISDIPGAFGIKRLVISGRWFLGGPTVIPNPKNTTLDMAGAMINVSFDGLAIDCNGQADATYSTGESFQNFHITGKPIFSGNTSVISPTKMAGLRLMGFRNASVEIGEFVNLDYDIITGGKDSVHISGYKSQTNRKVSLFFPPWSVIGGPINFSMSKIHFSTKKRAIQSYVPLNDTAVRDCSFNTGNGSDADGIVDINKYVLIGVPSVTGAFTPGEVVSGGTSGASATLVEVYENPWPFQVSQNETWLVLKDRSGLFAMNETLTGGYSGASAQTANHGGYFCQNKSFQNFEVGGHNHWESGSGGANGAVCLSVRDHEGVGPYPINHKYQVGSVGVNGGGSVGVRLKRISSVEIQGRFSQGAGNTPILLDSDCSDITIKKPSFFSAGNIDLNGMPRERLFLTEFNRNFVSPKTITGWVEKTLSTTGNTVIDMSADFNNFDTVGGIPPIQYEIYVEAKDSGSMTSGTNSAPRFRMFSPDFIAAVSQSNLAWGGLIDGVVAGRTMIVPADSDGDISYNAISTGADTMEVTLKVTEMRF